MTSAISIAATGDAYEAVVTYYGEYDGCSRLMWLEIDDDANGVMDRHADYTWSADDLLQTVAEDDGIDGTVDTLNTYTYDDDRHVIRYVTDEGVDGVLERELVYTWVGDLKMTETSTGTSEYFVQYTYDGDQEVLYEMDEDLDGVVDLAVTTTWLDATRTAGEQARYFTNPDSDYDEVHTWDGDLLTEELRTYTATGTQTVTTYEYNELGLQTRSEQRYVDPSEPYLLVETEYACP